MKCSWALMVFLLATSGCNFSSVQIPKGMSSSEVREAIDRAIESQGYTDSKELPVEDDQDEEDATYYFVQTPAHHAFSCGIWNTIWGFPLYWYHHTVEAHETYVRVNNHGYGWNIWAGLVSMLLPVYTSGGLHEAIERELQSSPASKAKTGALP